MSSMFSRYRNVFVCVFSLEGAGYQEAPTSTELKVLFLSDTVAQKHSPLHNLQSKMSCLGQFGPSTNVKNLFRTISKYNITHHIKAGARGGEAELLLSF